MFLTLGCQYLIAGVDGSGPGRFSPSSIHMDADSRNPEPEGIIGIVSGGGVEYLNVSCVKCCASNRCRISTWLKILNLWLCRTAGDEVHCSNGKEVAVT